MNDLFSFSPEIVQGVKEDPLDVIRDISKTCLGCRLGQTTDKHNTGFCYSGPVTAKIAMLGDMPQVEGTVLSQRVPIAGDFMRELGGWLRMLGVPEEDAFVLNAVQCRPIRARRRTPNSGRPTTRSWTPAFRTARCAC